MSGTKDPETQSPKLHSNTPRYSLVIRQHPVHARQCGFGTKDFRSIDPVPILQLIDAQGPPNLQSSHNYIVSASLWEKDEDKEITVIDIPQRSRARWVDPFQRVGLNGNVLPTVSVPPGQARVLVGTLIASSIVLEDLDGQLGVYFTFHDLSIRTLGEYRLKFALYEMNKEQSTTVLDTVMSDVIKTYTPRDFPGMLETSPLVRCFMKQGVKFPVKAGDNDHSQMEMSQEPRADISETESPLQHTPTSYSNPEDHSSHTITQN